MPPSHGQPPPPLSLLGILWGPLLLILLGLGICWKVVIYIVKKVYTKQFAGEDFRVRC